MTSSRSDFRSTLVGPASLSLLAAIGFLLRFQFLDNPVQFVETRRPEFAVALDPGRLLLQPAQAELAGPDTPDFFRGDEPRLLQHADMLLHAGQRHVELVGKLRDRSVRAPELLQHAAPCGVRERGKRSIETGWAILNHMVQYLTR